MNPLLRLEAERATAHQTGSAASGSIFLRLSKLPKAKLTGVVRHNLRQIDSPFHESRHGIDPVRSPTNVVLRGASSAEEVVEQYRQILSAQGVRERSNGVDLVEVVVSIHAGFERSEEYFEDSVCFMERYWDCPVVSAVIHYDQANPHVHMLIAPFLNGRRAGSKLVGYKGAAEARLQAFHREVGQRYGLRLYSHFTPAEKRALTIKTCAVIAEDPQRLFKGHLARPLQEAISSNIQRIAPFLTQVDV